MKLKSKSRIRKYYSFGRFGNYHIQVQNSDGYYISMVKTINNNRDLALKIKKLIIDNPNLITGQGYLFDIDYDK